MGIRTHFRSRTDELSFRRLVVISLIVASNFGCLSFTTIRIVPTNKQRRVRRCYRGLVTKIDTATIKENHTPLLSTSSCRPATSVSQVSQYDGDEVIRIGTEKLLSYAYTVQRARRGDATEPTEKSARNATTAAKSLVAYLTYNPQVLPVSDRGDTFHLIAACERALTQSLRAAGEAGDYKLIIRLVDSAVCYANNHPILTPRIFGEALQALDRTSSNISKLRQIWNLAAIGSSTEKHPQFLEGPVTAFEFNSMLSALASRGKVGACLDLYQQHTSELKLTSSTSTNERRPTRVLPDAYTATKLLTILTESIYEDDRSTTKSSDSACDRNYIKIIGYSPLHTSLKTLSASPCWQWNTAVDLIKSFPDTFEWNNQVCGALLKLHNRARDVYQRHRNGPQIAMAIVESMIDQHALIPDVITLSLAIKAMGDPFYPSSWKFAVHLLERMKFDESLPNPNAYCYSAAITGCVRCNAFPQAIRLLEEMTVGYSNPDNSTLGTGSWSPPPPNTWVFNTALLAIAGGKGGSPSKDALSLYNSRRRRKQSLSTVNEAQARRVLALRLLEQMEELHQKQGLDTAPDVVTYNTVLGLIASYPQEDKELSHTDGLASSEGIVKKLLLAMDDKGIDRDAITYHNIILAARDSAEVISFVEAAIKDIHIAGGSVAASSLNANKALRGKALDGLSFVFNSALSVLVKDWVTFKVVFKKMLETNTRMNAETTSHLISALGRSGRTSELCPLLTALSWRSKESSKTRQFFVADYFEVRSAQYDLPLEPKHYSEAIGVCLIANELKEAKRILSLMREKDMVPTNECLEKFCLAYARSAVSSMPKISKRKAQEDPGVTKEARLLAQTRAQNAHKILMSLNAPTQHASFAVSNACAVTGMWGEARSTLQVQHNLLLDQQKLRLSQADDIDLVNAAHEMLLRQAAVQGNLTSAMRIVDNIQRLSRKLRSIQNTEEDAKETSPQNARVPDGGKESFLSTLRKMSSLNESRPSIVSMRAELWTYVLKAASKAGNWRVCMNTLQYLRPFLEKGHPSKIDAENMEVSDKRYEQLAPSLTTVVRCLEQHSQYAWAVRAIDDWMVWSGRRPHLEAVSAAFRLLSAEGLGEEVHSLLLRCTLQDSSTSAGERDHADCYNEILHVQAVTALHCNGLYDDADDVFLAGVSQGHLYFALDEDDEKVVLDLHGMNIPLAHSAVRVAMRQTYTVASDTTKQNKSTDMVIVTGRGRNSLVKMRPMLRPEVQRMLLEEFYPPLNTFSIPNNMGALIVPAADISAWQDHQREQKGARMLAVAAVLKNLSSVDKLRDRITAAVVASNTNKDIQNQKDEESQGTGTS